MGARFKRVIGFAFAAALLGACAQAQTPTRPAANAEGRRLAETYCASCHAIGARDESRHAEAPPFRTLAQNYPIRALEEAFAEGVLTGHADMPEFVFTPAEIDALLGYIERVQTRE